MRVSTSVGLRPHGVACQFLNLTISAPYELGRARRSGDRAARRPLKICPVRRPPASPRLDIRDIKISLYQMPVTSDQTVEVLRAAGEATRLRILALLAREELAVLELTRILGQSQPRVSRHLKVLAEAGLVERFPDGAWVFYRLAGAGPVRDLLDTALSLISENDATLQRDAERLEGVAAERASQAASYFADNASQWDQIRSLYVSE